ncbi:hypothetical protein WJX72_001039 [[Myrmecia] bisecta]|uniref:Uncharacterized protein n=1 Tax=[Myrmecia] bisecta TaxID=41462 RepID=A0AAW1PNA1_9CHLO
MPVRAWPHLYRYNTSNLDIWLLSLLRCTVLAAVCLYVWRNSAKGGHGSRHEKWHRWLRRCVQATCITGQVLLLAKAVAVALAGNDNVMPGGPAGDVGLAFIFGALCTSLAASFAELYTAVSLLDEWQHQRHAHGEADEPLLGAPGETEKSKAKRQSRTVRLLARMSAIDGPVLFVAFTAGAVAAFAQALVPYFTGQIIDLAAIESDRHAFYVTIAKLVLVSFACAVFSGLRGGLFTVAMTRLNIRVRMTLFRSLLSQEVGFYDTTKIGDVISRLSADTTTVAAQVGLNLNVALRSLTQVFILLLFMLKASWRLTIITFVAVPIIVLICKIYGAFYRKLAERVQTELAAANTVSEEMLGSMTTVLAHGAADSAAAAYQQCLNKYNKLQMTEAVAYAFYTITTIFLPNTISAMILLFGGHLVLAGRMSPGALVSFMLLQQSLSSAFQTMGDVFSSLAGAVGAADKVVELITRQPKIPPPGGLQPANFQGRVELRDVVFAYPARPEITVLKGLNLHINPGEVVALVGPSGGGKSSIVKLLERYYMPLSGSVLFDGYDVGSYDPKWLKQRVALVSQEPVLYARSIYRNICFGVEDEDGCAPPSREDVEAAARLANAHDFIKALPQGYETECGDKGVQMSGGQKQRIAIARALVRRPTILLLDEATSALDAESESIVQEALDRLMLRCTTLVIAHRLSTIQNATRILVITKGIVAEEGSHEALLEQRGIYSQLVRRQMQKTTSSASLARGDSELSFSRFALQRTASEPRNLGTDQ